MRGKSILISGASSGIGEALAVECARQGAKALFLCGRNRERLDAVVAQCRQLGVKLIRGEIVDVTDEQAVREWVRRANVEQPLEVVFANAGIATGSEREDNVRRTFATNVGGVLNVSLPAIECFRQSKVKSPHLVLTASIAGYAPLSGCPAYSGTKAAVKTWGLAMRGLLKQEGICVNVVCPGFIRSRMTAVNTCPMPFFMEADRAARKIIRRVRRNVGLIAFPWPMRLAVWLLSILPAFLTEFIAGLLPQKIRRQGVVTRDSQQAGQLDTCSR